MKKLIGFIVVLLLIIFIFVKVINNAKDYSLEYELNGYKVLEKYNKKNKLYSFNISKDDYNFYFIYEGKYSNNRKIIDSIKVTNNEEEDIVCGSIKVRGNELRTQCIKDYEYIDNSLLEEYTDKTEYIKETNNVKMYSDKYDYYIWDNKGIISIKDENKYNFLDDEAYNNYLSYQIGNYILFADYDNQRTINKFYIFDKEKNKVEEWKLKTDIYLDSYFMGDYEGYVYLFDRKEKVEYKIDVKKKKISKVSNKDGGIVYEGEWKDYPLEKLVYNDYLFNGINNYKYSIEDNKLYLTLYDSNYHIRVFDGDIIDIIKVKGDRVYFLSGDKLYAFDFENGLELLLSSFEWNFSSKNKLFIFE